MANDAIQMFDPKRNYGNYKNEYDSAISSVINSGLFINGPEVSQLEKKLEIYTGAKHCISCANGTDALYLMLRAIDIGVNDEVITVSHTWISTSEAIALVGAIPKFVDISYDDYNIDYSKIEQSINENTKAILFVSLYGLMPNCEKLLDIAKKHNLYLLEDGAQSFGAMYNNTKSCSCTYTDIATTSFFPSKPLGCWGDGGAVFTNNTDLAVKIRAIKSHGGKERFKHTYIGVNSRLDTLQAAILLKKINWFESDIEKRITVANHYTAKLSNLSNQLVLPKYGKEYRHVWAQYSLLCENKYVRDDLVEHLKKNKVNVAIFYPIGCHHQECFNYLSKVELPVTDDVCSKIINLPCYAEITENEQNYIIDLLYKYYQK